MSRFTVRVTGLREAINAFRSMVDHLPGSSAAANARIEAQVGAVLYRYYGPKLGKFFTVTSETGGGKSLARVTVESNDYRVIGFERGTHPHWIFPHTKRIAGHGGTLAWPGGGNATAFAAYIWHPGTLGHHYQRDVEDELVSIATIEWTGAIHEVLPRW